jgi:hypothetical protein
VWHISFVSSYLHYKGNIYNSDFLTPYESVTKVAPPREKYKGVSDILADLDTDRLFDVLSDCELDASDHERDSGSDFGPLLPQVEDENEVV